MPVRAEWHQHASSKGRGSGTLGLTLKALDAQSAQSGVPGNPPWSRAPTRSTRGLVPISLSRRALKEGCPGWLLQDCRWIPGHLEPQDRVPSFWDQSKHTTHWQWLSCPKPSKHQASNDLPLPLTPEIALDGSLDSSLLLQPLQQTPSSGGSCYVSIRLLVGLLLRTLSS